MLGLRKELTAARYSLFITEWCDKRCPYCDIPEMDIRRDSDENLIRKYLPLIDQGDFDCYTITGGEPALSANLDLIFHIITRPVKVNTNGAFIESAYFERYYDRIDEIGLHILNNPDTPLPDNPIIYDEKVTLYVPVNKFNYMRSKKLAEDNPNITFNFIPHIRKRVADIGFRSMDRDDINHLDNLLCDTTNTQSSSLKRIRGISNDGLESNRKFCQNSNVRYLFDFVGNKIFRCAKSRIYNDYYPLNNTNIRKAHKMELFRQTDEWDEACKDCWYFTYFLPYAIRNKIMRSV